MTWIKKGVIFDKEWAQLPVVDNSSESWYTIYYSTRDENGRSIPKCILIDKKTLSVLTHSVYQPNIPLGKPGSFDSHGVMPSSIITLEDGTKYMYYVGWSKRIDVPYWNSTGLAISNDGGLTWEKYSEGPIFIGDNGNWVGTVEISKRENNYWLMYYSSCHWEIIEGKQEPVYDIKEAISKDGINWKTQTQKQPLISLKDEEGGIASIRRIEDKLYYSVRKKKDYRTNPLKTYRIYSSDLFKHGIKCINNTWLEFHPDSGELMNAYPFIVEEHDKYIMFYNSDFGSSGISYAIKIK